MLEILKNLPFLRRLRRPDRDRDALAEEKWTADFSNSRKRRFPDEDAEAYEGRSERNSYLLKLRRGRCIAWVEDPYYRYADTVLEAELRLCGSPVYGAAGLQFRRSDDGSYYSVLVSDRGYFRLDAVFNGSPLPLVGWTEVPGGWAAGQLLRLRVIALGDRITVVLNDRWAAEVQDGTLASGRVALAAASYEDGSGFAVRFERFSVESRPVEVEAAHLRWNTLIKVDGEGRRRLAETFLAMGQPLSALVQLKRAWKGAGALRSQSELLLAARCALALSLLEEAEEYLDRCVEVDPESEAGRDAMAEKARQLYLAGRYADLRSHAEDALRFFPEDPVLHTLLGHAYANLGAPERAAASYGRALELDGENGLVAWNAAQARERMGDRSGAVDLYLKAARSFLRSENYSDLGLTIPRILELAPEDPEGRALAGKRAFAAEQWAEAEKELAAAERLRGEGPEDAAVPYLRALLLIRRGRRAAALPLLERAATLEPDYGPFRFRLAECRFLLKGDGRDPVLDSDLEAALRLCGGDGWTENLAAQVALAAGDLESAAAYLEKAAAVLDGEAVVLANRAELAYLRGRGDEALALLDAGAAAASADDKGGRLAGRRGAILYRMGRVEEAEEAFRKAAAAAPEETDHLRSRASCLIDLGCYGEADELLARIFEAEPSPAVLELISYVAAKKGEYPRAEAACRLALEAEPKNVSILSSLAWLYLTMGRWKGAEDAVSRLEAAAAESGDAAAAEGASELRRRLTDALTKELPCAACGRTWRVLKAPPAMGALRLVAEPPDELPAGTCQKCGRTYCIGCGKNALDDAGRFLCPVCGERLKLLDDGLKKLLADWAAGAGTAGD